MSKSKPITVRTFEDLDVWKVCRELWTRLSNLVGTS
jgi:hypothetical protein